MGDKKLRAQPSLAPRVAVKPTQTRATRTNVSRSAEQWRSADERGVAPRLGHDFSKVRVLSGHSSASTGVNDQTQSGGLDPKPAVGGNGQPAPAKAAKDDT